MYKYFSFRIVWVSELCSFDLLVSIDFVKCWNHRQKDPNLLK